jgi:threonine/homoserine/homoserine lactone efflux protein
MFTVEVLGALLLLAGLVYLAYAAINRGRMSDPAANRDEAGKRTLEPRHRGLGFLGWKANWPGLVLAAIGAVLLLSSLF